MDMCMACRENPTKCRGLCDKCYTRCLNLIKRKMITWKILEEQGRCLPPCPASNHHIRASQNVPDLEAYRSSKPVDGYVPRCRHGAFDGECPICEKEARSRIEISNEETNYRRECPKHIYRRPARRGSLNDR